MKNKKFLFSFLIVILGFSYASDGEYWLSLLCVILSLVLSLSTTNFATLKHVCVPLTLALSGQILLTSQTSLFEEVSTLPCLIVANTVVAMIWNQECHDSMHRSILLFFWVYIAFACLSFLIPAARFSSLLVFYYVSLIFLPSILTYAFQCYQEARKSSDFVHSSIVR